MDQITNKQMKEIINQDIPKNINLIAVKTEEGYIMYVKNNSRSWRKVNGKPVNKENVEKEIRFNIMYV